jgi:hypothetical protein
MLESDRVALDRVNGLGRWNLWWTYEYDRDPLLRGLAAASFLYGNRAGDRGSGNFHVGKQSGASCEASSLGFRPSCGGASGTRFQGAARQREINPRPSNSNMGVWNTRGLNNVARQGCRSKQSNS